MRLEFGKEAWTSEKIWGIIDIELICGCSKALGTQEKVAQSYPALCDPMDYTIHGILQARILEWVAIPFSRGSSQPRDGTQVSLIAD